MNTYKVELTQEGVYKDKCPHGLKATRGKTVKLGSLECTMCHYFVSLSHKQENKNSDDWYFQKPETVEEVHCNYDERKIEEKL